MSMSTANTSEALSSVGYKRIHQSVETLAERVKWILDTRGLSARGLSLAAGLSQSHIGQIARGQIKGEVAPEVLAKIAEAGAVDLLWLMTGDGDPEGQKAPETVLVLDNPPISPETRKLLDRYRASPRGAALDDETWQKLEDACGRYGEPKDEAAIDALAGVLLGLKGRPAPKPAAERDLKGFMPAPKPTKKRGR